MTRIHRIDMPRVYDLLALGLTNLQIADRLGCAPNSVTAWKRKLGFKVLPHGGSAHRKRGVAPINKGTLASSVKARAVKTLPPVVAKPPEPPIRYGRNPCAWPVGEKPFRQCGARTERGRVYCGDHCALAYVGKSGAGGGMKLEKTWVVP